MFAVSNPPNHAVRFLDAEVSHHSPSPLAGGWLIVPNRSESNAAIAPES